MRIACYTPLPPERSGIADYSYELFEELRHHLDIVAVVRDDLVGQDRAPEGVEVVGISSFDARAVDLAVYQMGNNPKYHRFLFQALLEEPGLVVLHDPSLADFHAEMCRLADSGVFRAEIAFDAPERRLDDDLPLIEVAPGELNLDRLAVLLCRRVLESSVRTLVHSEAIARELARRYPRAEVAAIPLPAHVLDVAERPAARAPGEVVFGVFGGINYYKRIDSVVEAFVALRREFPRARLVVAGRPDDREMTERLRRLASTGELAGALEVKTDLSLAELEAEMAACDVAISLRFPTAGEMSATLMRAFGAGRPAIVTDVLQFEALDARFCWRVPVEREAEERALLAIMRRIAADPAACVEAGRLAREFVASSATYALVARAYVDQVEACRSRLGRTRGRHWPYTLAANQRLGVNLVSAAKPGGDAAAADEATAHALGRAGIDVVRQGLGTLDPRALARLGRAAWKRDPALPAASVFALERREERQRRPSLEARSDEELRRALGRQGRAIAETVEVSELNAIDLLVPSPRETRRFALVAREHHERGRKVVAMIAADLLPLAVDHMFLLRACDEVWVPSDFSADIVRVATYAPVAVVPPTLACLQPAAARGSLRPSADEERADGAGPAAKHADASDAFKGHLPARRAPVRVLVLADGEVGLARSNPFAGIAAYAAAISPRRRNLDAELVVAASGVAPGSEAAARLADEVEAVAGTLVIADTARARQRLLESCEIVVCLHRSTAFGAHAAEAMAAAKAVVATAFGGNVEYMGPRSAALVGFRLERVSLGDYYLDNPRLADFAPGQAWARPEIDEAAAWIARLVARPALRLAMGRRAREVVVAAFDPRRAARVMAERLAALEHRAPMDREESFATPARLRVRPRTDSVSA